MQTTIILAGTRVQTPVHSDDWMRGDRYGVAVRSIQSRLYGPITLVLLDRSGRKRRFLTDDLTVIS